ncbi:MAG: hypothetical protein ABFC96_15300 [Thermoguttaceae bacterium]
MKYALSLIALAGTLSWPVVAVGGSPEARIAEKHSPAIVYLEKSRGLALGGAYFHGDPLTRELVRQALLIAARDELGLVTRDAWLGDAMPTQGDNPPLDIVVSPSRPLSLLEILRGFYPVQWIIAHDDVRVADELDYIAVATEMEKRSRGYFVSALKQAGWDGKPHAIHPKGQMPEGVEESLNQWTFTSQFQAVRSLHEAIAAQGESPELLGALVRGYANLGMLTELCPHPAQKVFKARALLYAQRCLARDPKSAWCRWHRAYALAMTGLPAAALADLAEGEKLRQKALTSDSKSARPPWVKIIDAFCRYDAEWLESSPDDSGLAGLCSYLVLERSGCAEMAIESGRAQLSKMPECYRIYDGLNGMGGVGLHHYSTAAGMVTLGQKLYGRLAAMPGLPAAVADLAAERKEAPPRAAFAPRGVTSLADEFKARAAIIAALRATRPAADDAGEPSWAALGQLIWEQSFNQIGDRVAFESSTLGVSPESFLDTASPLTDGHPCLPLVEVFSWDQKKLKRAVEHLPQVPVERLEMSAHRRSTQVYLAAPAEWPHLIDVIMQCNTSETDYELMLVIPIYLDIHKPGFGRRLMRVSPYSPCAKATLIEYDWDNVKKDAAEWEKAAAKQPRVLEALGKRYCDLRRFADAERCLKKALDISPGIERSFKLADVYKKQDKMDQWQATLEDVLNQPDYGLSHARACEALASHFMSRRQWSKAITYAEGAAASYSGDGLMSAANCHEGLLHWDKAEQFRRALAQRYRGQEYHWYYFCKRTGHGDLKAARALVLPTVYSGPEPPPDYIDRGVAPIFYLLDRQPEKALPLLETAFQQGDPLYYGFYLILANDQLNRRDKLDAVFQRIRAEGLNYPSPRTGKVRKDRIGLAAMIADDLKKGGKGDIDLVKAEKLVADGDVFDQSHFYYWLGKYLSLHGNGDKAVEYWKKCMECPEMALESRTLAGAELLERGVKPEDYKDRWREPATPPKTAKPR